jgi:hypothetical protein
MNKFKFYFILSITSLSLFSCSKNDTATMSPPRDYAVQNTADMNDIEEYLNNYYITVSDKPGLPDDQDVVFTKIPDGGTQASIMSYKDRTTFPKLLSRAVKLHDITYKLYYLVLREGSGTSPSNVDGVLASYRGDFLEQKVQVVGTSSTLTATLFEEVKYPQQIISLFSTIKGWSETFPQFKTGSYVAKEDGTISYRDFGAGVIFIPSGLGYYSSGSASIPAYAPLIFSFKLFELQRLDQDADGIPSYLEDLDGDGYIYDYRNTVNYPTTPTDDIRYADDSDKDGIPNALDVDDDGDGIGTRIEVTATNGSIIPFAAIPSCDGNTTDPARVKRHLVKCN